MQPSIATPGVQTVHCRPWMNRQSNVLTTTSLRYYISVKTLYLSSSLVSWSYSDENPFPLWNNISSLTPPSYLGIHSCCLWIEEKHDSITTRNEAAIIFDEDRFYHIKNLRAESRYLPLIQKSDNSTADKLSLSLDQFDLIFETFLRTQCLSTYISQGDKELMLFSWIDGWN